MRAATALTVLGTYPLGVYAGSGQVPDPEEVKKMSNEAGTLLSCGHDGCGCRVRIEVACHCSGTDQAYICKCGDEMVVVP
jgi:metallothionein